MAGWGAVDTVATPLSLTAYGPPRGSPLGDREGHRYGDP